MGAVRRRARAVSPAVGTVLLIAIVLLFSVVASYVFFGLSDTSDPAPQVAWDSESGDGAAAYELIHGGGETVDGDRLELEGTADPDRAEGQTIRTDDAISFYPIDEEVVVLWRGEDTSYELTTIDVRQPLPAPDEGCPWVQAESNGGVDEVRVNGLVVNCDVETDDDVHVENGGVVVGNVLSRIKVLDLDDAAIYGSVETEKVANLQNGTVTGSIVSNTEEVKLYDTEVGGSIDAADEAEVLAGSVVGGDVVSRTGVTKVDDSVVEGSVTADGRVDLDDATIEGDVYADPADFDCSNSTIGGQDCATYSPRDPDDW